jgi:hypothetical protein
MVNFTLVSRSYYYLRRRSPGPPCPPDHRQAGERGVSVRAISTAEKADRKDVCLSVDNRCADVGFTMSEAGRILLQAQEDLRSIRERISVGDEAQWHREHLQQAVENAESELKLKAEAMLSTVVHGAAPLPSNSFRADPCSATPPQQLPALQLPATRTRSAGDPTRLSAAAHHASAVNNPAGNRKYLAQRLGIQPSALSSAPRPVGQRATMGKLNKVLPSPPPPANASACHCVLKRMIGLRRK